MGRIDNEAYQVLKDKVKDGSFSQQEKFKRLTQSAVIPDQIKHQVEDVIIDLLVTPELFFDEKEEVSSKDAKIVNHYAVEDPEFYDHVKGKLSSSKFQALLFSEKASCENFLRVPKEHPFKEDLIKDATVDSNQPLEKQFLLNKTSQNFAWNATLSKELLENYDQFLSDDQMAALVIKAPKGSALREYFKDCFEQAPQEIVKPKVIEKPPLSKRFLSFFSPKAVSPQPVSSEVQKPSLLNRLLSVFSPKNAKNTEAVNVNSSALILGKIKSKLIELPKTKKEDISQTESIVGNDTFVQESSSDFLGNITENNDVTNTTGLGNRTENNDVTNTTGLGNLTVGNTSAVSENSLILGNVTDTPELKNMVERKTGMIDQDIEDFFNNMSMSETTTYVPNTSSAVLGNITCTGDSTGLGNTTQSRSHANSTGFGNISVSSDETLVGNVTKQEGSSILGNVSQFDDSVVQGNTTRNSTEKSTEFNYSDALGNTTPNNSFAFNEYTFFMSQPMIEVADENDSSINDISAIFLVEDKDEFTLEI